MHPDRTDDHTRWPAVVLLPLILVSSAGCTFDSGLVVSVDLTITTDHGMTILADHDQPIQSDWTVMDALHEATDVETAYGGGFVLRIDGRPQHGDDGDWFYEVDGIQSGKGATDHHLQGGEVVHWDLRPWSVPGVPPGLWNSFPRTDVTHIHHADLEADGSWDGTWNGTWPDGPAVLHVGPDAAPWDDIHGAKLDGETLVVGAARLPPPWTLTVRVGPVGTAHGVVVHGGMEDADPRMLPHKGYGHAVTPEQEVVVIP